MRDFDWLKIDKKCNLDGMVTFAVVSVLQTAKVKKKVQNRSLT